MGLGGLIVVRESRVYPLIRRAFEVLTVGGLSAQQYGSGPAGARCGDTAMGLDVAKQLVEAAMRLPVQQHLAVMCVVFTDDIRRGEACWREIGYFVEAEIGPTKCRWGRFGVEYFTRYWMRRDGSFREFEAICEDADWQAVRRWYLRTVDAVMTRWCVMAESELERLCDRLVPKVVEFCA